MPLYKKDLLNLLANQTGDETDEWITQFGNELLYEESEVREIDKGKKLLYEDLLDCQKENQELKTYIKLLADKKKLQEDKELLKLMETKLGKTK